VNIPPGLFPFQCFQRANLRRTREHTHGYEKYLQAKRETQKPATTVEETAADNMILGMSQGLEERCHFGAGDKEEVREESRHIIQHQQETRYSFLRAEIC